MSTQPVQLPPTPRYQQPKKLARRLFKGLVGFPVEEQPAAAHAPDPSSVAQAQATVATLMEAVTAADTHEQSKQAVRDTFASQDSVLPTAQVPKRRRGRPQIHPGNTVQERERNRKRKKRAKAQAKFAELLNHYGVTVDSVIPARLKEKYTIEFNTYYELLEDERVQSELFEELSREIGVTPKRPGTGVNKKTKLPLLSNGKFLLEPPEGKGEVTFSGDPAKIHGIRQQQERGLSRPGGEDEFLNIPKSLLASRDELPAGDRRRVQPQGRGSDEGPGPDDED